jgi:hypothetical protein
VHSFHSLYSITVVPAAITSHRHVPRTELAVAGGPSSGFTLECEDHDY